MVTVSIIWPIAEEYDGFESASQRKRHDWHVMHARDVMHSGQTNLEREAAVQWWWAPGFRREEIKAMWSAAVQPQAVMQYLNLK